MMASPAARSLLKRRVPSLESIIKRRGSSSYLRQGRVSVSTRRVYDCEKVVYAATGAASVVLAYEFFGATKTSTCLEAENSLSVTCFEPGTVDEIGQIVTEYYSHGNGSLSNIVGMQKIVEALRVHARNFCDLLERDSNISIEDIDTSESEEPNAEFPSLAVHIVNEIGECDEIQLNCPTGVPIENELFVGRMLLVVRPQNPEDDPHYDDKRLSEHSRLDVQIQGRFKYVPKRTLYCGGEITDQMKLGVLSKGLANLLLTLLSGLVGANIEYSFGDGNNFPYISFPLWTAMDNIVITKPGHTLPQIGKPFVESLASISARKESGSTGDWNTEDTYSMSFSSYCVDLPTWHVAGLGVVQEIPLASFWGDSSLRLVVYEKGDNHACQHVHMQDTNRYLIALQMKFLGIPTGEDLPGQSDQYLVAS